MVLKLFSSLAWPAVLVESIGKGEGAVDSLPGAVAGSLAVLSAFLHPLSPAIELTGLGPCLA